MLLEAKILSEVTTYLKYAKFLPEKHRKEVWTELTDRNMQMHVENVQELLKWLQEKIS